MKKVYLLPLLLLISLTGFGQTIQSSGAGSGDWNDPLSWTPNTVPNSGNSTAIIINNGHTITLTAIETIDQTTINSGGLLVINSGITLTLNNGAGNELTLSSGGTITNNGTIAFGAIPPRTMIVNGTLNNAGVLSGSNSSKLVFNSGSNYFHQFADGGTIPAAAWNAASTVHIVGYISGNSTPPSGLGQTFGNFVWNSPAQDQTIILGGLPTSINGSFTVADTGLDALYYSVGGSGGTMNIVGNLNVTGGVLGWTSGDAGPSTLNVSGDIAFSSGYTQLADDQNLTINVTGNFSISGDAQVDFAATTAITNLNLQGNYTFTGGDIFVNGGTGNLNFTGASTKNFTSSLTPSGNINYSVASLSTLTLGSSDFIAGGGTFSLSGTLQVASTGGSGALQNGISEGNIRVSGTRTYASGSTIVYNGTGAQFIGNGFPSGSDVNLVIDNASNVTLSTSLDIVALSTLTLTSGSIVIGTQTLTINGTVSGSGGIVGGPSSNLVIGGTGAFGTLNFNGTNQLLNFTMNRSSSGSVNLGGDLTILGSLTHTDGALVLGSNTLTISGTYARTFGTISVTSASSIVVNGSGPLPSGSAGITGSALGTLTLNRSSSTLDVSASFAITNLNLVSGILNNGSGLSMVTGGIITRNEQGSMTTSPNNTTNAYNVVYSVTGPTNTGPELPINTTALANFTKQGTGALTLGSDLTVNGILTLSDGTFNSGSNDIDLKGNFVSNGASTLTGSAITFSGITSISGSAVPVFGNITVSGTLTPQATFSINGNLVNDGTLNAGSATIIFGGTTTISGSSVSSFNNISITGTLTAPAGNMNVAGNWNNTGTFNNGVATNTVTFNGTTTFTGAGITQFSGVTISGAVTSSSTLRVAGNFTNNGTFTGGTGTLALNGTSAQTISGSSPTTFNNITVTNVANPTSVQITSAQNLRGILTLSAGTQFKAGNLLFTLLSTDDEPAVIDAAIAALPAGASVSGNLIIQRYMSIEGGSNDPLNNNGRIYRNISSPVQNPQVSDLQVEIPVTGSFTGTSVCSGCGSTQSMFLYRESEIGDTNGSGGNNFDDGYEDFPSAANTEMLTPGRGYSVFVRGNIAPISGAGNARFDLRGPINSGTIDYVSTAGVTYTSTGTPANDGWNLVGNPYPSTIDWDAASGWTKTGIINTIYMIDNGSAAGTYASYVGGVGGTNGGSRYIPIGQAFWVQASGSPTFQSTELVKAAGNSTTFFREAAHSDLLSITLSDGSKRDEVLVYFDSNTTDELDMNGGDALKLKNNIFNLSSVTPAGVKLAINGSASLVDCSKEIKLNISDANSGIYQFELSQMDSFEDGVEISLIDKFLGTIIDVKNQATYQFEITDDEKSTAERFSLIFKNGIDNKIQSVTDGKSCREGSIILIASGASENGSYKWYESLASSDPILGANTSNYKTPFLTQTRNYFVAAVNAIGCEGERKLVKAEVIQYEDVSISEPEYGLLKSTFAEGNVWYFNDEVIEGGNKQNITVDKSGVYKVEISIGSCKTVDSYDFVVTALEKNSAETVSLYPNPVTTELIINVKGKNIAFINLISNTGVQVYTETVRAGAENITLDMRSNPAGLYLVKLIGIDKSVSTYKIMKR